MNAAAAAAQKTEILMVTPLVSFSPGANFWRGVVNAVKQAAQRKAAPDRELIDGQGRGLARLTRAGAPPM